MIILLLSVIFVLLLFNWIRLIYYAIRLKVPGPVPLPFLGNAHLFVSYTEFLGVLNKFSRKYGDVFRIFFFSNPIVIVNHPKYLEQILSSTEYITKGRTYRFMEPWFGNGLLTSTGHQWKTHRKFLTPAFHFNILQDFLPVFCKNTRTLAKKMQSLPKGIEMNLFPIIAASVHDSIMESIMGVAVNAQEQNEELDYVKAINEMAHIISQRMQISYLAENLIFDMLPIKSRHDKALKVLHAHTKIVIQARREELKKNNTPSLKSKDDVGMKNRYAFMDLLLLSDINDQLITDEVNTFMFEGQDTTTTGIVWALYILSKHRDVQEKLYAELQSIFTDDMDRDPTYNEIQQMKYMDLVLKESMRLHAPVPLIERLIEKDCELGGLKLIKGTTVTLNLFEIHRNPDLYEDPLHFKPERFEKPLKHPFDFLVFSGGPRNCIGQKFALLAIKVTLTSIIKNFVILPTDIEPIYCAELVLKSKNGINVKLSRRN